MKLRKWISVLLCMLLCVGMLLTMALAEEEESTGATVDTWDGSVDISWYTGEETEYDITSAAALAGVAKLASEKKYVSK